MFVSCPGPVMCFSTYGSGLFFGLKQYLSLSSQALVCPLAESTIWGISCESNLF